MAGKADLPSVAVSAQRPFRSDTNYLIHESVKI